MKLHVETGVTSEYGPCDCCGEPSRCISGFVYDESGAAVAAYFVHWTRNRPDHGANFDLVVGRWGDGARSSDRVGIALRYRSSPAGFMVIDAPERPFASGQTLFDRALRRDEVMGTNAATDAFAIVDSIWLGDPRIEEVRRRGTSEKSRP